MLNFEDVKELAQGLKDRGGRAYLVGGWVRDQHMGLESKDYDLEVYNVAPRILKHELTIFSLFKKEKLNVVGESFQVYKVGLNLDVSLPRRDQKVGDGHKGFLVVGDPTMSTVEAARRRDFTINALMFDPLTIETIDHFGGLSDLEYGILRMVDPETFVEDSLRVLRGVQFASRFGFKFDDETTKVMSFVELADLPRERVWGEFEKLLMLSPKPSDGLWHLQALGINEKLFPELNVLRGTPQEFDWHPEGDVMIHSFAAVDVAKTLISDLPYAEQVTVMLATLFHDLGKYETTVKNEEGKFVAYGHAEAGVSLARNMLDRFNLHSIDGYDVRSQVMALVEFHMHPSQFAKQKVGDSAFRRLSTKVDLNLLAKVFRADSLSRNVNKYGIIFDGESCDWFEDKIAHLEIKPKGPDKILLGRNLIELGMKPSKAMGDLINKVYELQLDGLVTNLDEALEVVRKELDSLAIVVSSVR